jgi:peptidoglycan pentaglycine glycine transferase (the first glycine)
MKFVHVEQKHKNNFEKFVNSRKETTCMQMWEWESFRNKLTPKLFHRYAVIDDERNFHLAATLASYKYRSLGNVIYIPQGPIWDDAKSLEIFAREIRKIARSQNCFLIVVEPRVERDSIKFKELENSGYKFTDKAIQPRETVFLDLTQKEEDLLASFSKTTRYNIRYAERKGVIVKKYSSPKDIDRIKDLYKLMQVTRQRKYFQLQSRDYFDNLWKEFSNAGKVTLYEAWYKKELLHSMILINNNKWAGSLFSGSSRKYSKLKATYLARWESIKDAKAKGCEIYDFFGATKSEDPSHPFYHTTQFKLGFGRVIKEFAGTFEIILNPIKYYAWRFLERFNFFKFYEDSFIKEFSKKNAYQEQT